METTKLSTKGQIIIPKAIRKHHQWEAGQELSVREIEEGVLLTSKKPFTSNTLDDVAGCLAFTGKAKTVKEMELGIKKGIADKYGRR